MPCSEFLATFKDRGFFHQATNEEGLDDLLSSRKIPAYIGFDCTATSLHVGSLLQIMILKWLQKFGLKPIVVLGGGTTRIGDPSGKDKTRQMQTEQQIAINMQGIKSVLEKFITFGEGPSDALLVDNDKWLKSLNYIDFLRDIGKHFSINRMLSFDSVKLRLEREQNLSFLEFNYMLLQAYDFVELYKNYGCQLQIGGSDQWGNIVNGIELGRRLGLKDELFGLTTPLITTSSGAKMGKTADGAVWLDVEMFSPYDYWQFWRNTEDADVIKFLRFFTELPLTEIQKLEKLEGADINQAKIILANEATKLCHGVEEALQAEQTAKKTFAEGNAGDSLPSVEVSKSDLEAGIAAFKILQTCGLAESGGAARRLIKGGGGKVNDVKFNDDAQLVTLDDVNNEGFIKISAGKKKHTVVRIKNV